MVNDKETRDIILHDKNPILLYLAVKTFTPGSSTILLHSVITHADVPSGT